MKSIGLFACFHGVDKRPASVGSHSCAPRARFVLVLAALFCGGQALAADDYAASTSTSGTVSPGGSASGSIETAGDIDWFRVSLTAGTVYRIDLRGSATSGGTLVDPFVSLRNSAGTVLDDDDDSGAGLDSLFTYTPTVSGTYYLAARGYGTTTGTYTVALTVGSTDDYAASTSTTGAVAVGGSATGSVETGGDIDWFRVSLTAGTAYRIDLRGSATSGGTLVDPSVSLRNSTGTVLDDDDDSGTGLDSQLSYTPSASGTYYIEAFGYGTTTGTYTIAVTNTSGAAIALRVGAIFSTAQANSRSFLRFYNTGAAASTATVTLSDYVSGQALGQWTSPSIPAGAEVQYSIGTVESGTDASFTKPSFYSVSLQSQMTGYFQHVLWRSVDGTLTNLSTCASGVTADSTKLGGVHSSLLGGAYPSSIVVNNTGVTSAAATLGIFDARNGTRLGTYTSAAILANGHEIVSVTAIESVVGTPTAGMSHYVVNLEGTFTGFLQHLVTNTQAGVVTDMTTACSMNGVASAAVSPLRAGAIFSTAQTNSRSFLRFFNTGISAGTATVSLRNAATGQSVGQWTTPSIPANAEVQYPIGTVETGTGQNFTKPSYYTISMTSTFGGHFQHVLWRSADGTLTNLSTCAAGVTADSTKLGGVHSSLLGSAYPSSVVVNNTGTTAASVVLGIFDARDGTGLGTYTTDSIPANGQAVLAVAAIESDLGFSPTSGMYHYVVRAEGTFTGFLQHLVNNIQAGVTTDMTTECALATAAAGGTTPYTLTAINASSGTGSGSVVASPAGPNYASGTVVTLTATANVGSTFAGWSGNCSGTATTCQITMSGNRSATARFNLTTGSGGGGGSGSTCTASAGATAAGMSFAPPALPNGTVGQPYSFSYAPFPQGGSSPYHFQLGSGVGFPPSLLVLGPNDGILSGTPSIAGTSNFQVCAVDLGGNSVCCNAQLTIEAAQAPAGDASQVTGISSYGGENPYVTLDFIISPPLNNISITCTWTGYSSGMTLVTTTRTGPDGTGICSNAAVASWNEPHSIMTDATVTGTYWGLHTSHYTP